MKDVYSIIQQLADQHLEELKPVDYILDYYTNPMKGVIDPRDKKEFVKWFHENEKDIESIPSLLDIQTEENIEITDTNDALWAIADDMRDRKEKGDFETYRDAYRWAEKNISKKGVNITAKKLERAYHKAKSEGRVQ